MIPGRTTAVAVKGIIEVDNTIDLTPFMDIANEMVTEFCTDSRFGYTNYRLELIERWLSAHFYAVRDQRTQSENAGSVGQSFQTKVDLGLQLTIYGQQVMLIDSLGALAALQKRAQEGVPPKPGIRWMGKTVIRESDLPDAGVFQ